MVDDRHYAKSENRRISATVGPIGMKFGMVNDVYWSSEQYLQLRRWPPFWTIYTSLATVGSIGAKFGMVMPIGSL